MLKLLTSKDNLLLLHTANDRLPSTVASQSSEADKERERVSDKEQANLAKKEDGST